VILIGAGMNRRGSLKKKQKESFCFLEVTHFWIIEYSRVLTLNTGFGMIDALLYKEG
jgi:hypothetical protein